MSEPVSDPLRRSIEVEYWVAEENGSFTDPGGLVDASPGAEREFAEPVLGAEMTPCGLTVELRQELYERLGDVLSRAEEIDKQLVPPATPVGDETVTELESNRACIQNRVVGSDFQYARHCVGAHIHVEQRPGREINQHNAFVALDPALALANSSPYYNGEWLAAGARSKLYRRVTYDDVPHQGRLWRYADDTREWPRRLERRFEELLVRAEEKDVDQATTEANFNPKSAIWMPVQLRTEFGTVEWRSLDCSLPGDALRLANSVADVMKRLDNATFRIDGDSGRVTDDRIVLPEFDTVLRYVNAVIENGPDSETVRPYPDRMRFDVGAYSPVLHEIDGRETVTAAEARELRLTHTDRLERDARNAARQRE